MAGWSSGSSSSRHWLDLELGTFLSPCVDPFSNFGEIRMLSVLREGLRDFVSFFSGRRLLTGKTGLRPIWSNCSQLDWFEWPPLRFLFFLQQWHVSKRCFQQMNVFSAVCVVVSQNKNVACTPACWFHPCLFVVCTPCFFFGGTHLFLFVVCTRVFLVAHPLFF